MLGFLERSGVAASAIKPEWGPPLRIYDIRGARPLEVANHDVKKGWSIFESALEGLGVGLTVEATLSAVRK